MTGIWRDIVEKVRAMQDWQNEETQNFLSRVRECLSYMTQWKKDCWIMNQAKFVKKDTSVFSLEVYDLKEQQKHVQKLLSQLQVLAKQEEGTEEEGKKLLSAAWTQIGDLLASLRYEPYIDDQYEIKE